MPEQLLSGRYKILSPLGKGGFGETFLAEDTQYPGNRQCVVKKLNPQVNNPEIWNNACRLFQREAEILSKLGKHDQIPELFAHFEEDGHFFLVQEFIDGLDLSHEFKAGNTKSEYYTLNLIEDTLEVLKFVHQEGVIHRDIKPSNLIRRKDDGKLVLIDFGAVKSIGLQTTLPSNNTAHTVSICTPGYTPNEQYAGQPKLSSDIYALGMMAIQSLTGQNPGVLPRSEEDDELIWKDQINVSPPLATILDTMVLSDFRQRYTNAEVALDAIKKLHQQPISISPSQPITGLNNVIPQPETPLPTATPLSMPGPSLKNKLPIKTFFIALLLGLIGGAAGTIYGIKKFVPAMLTGEDTSQPIGGADNLQADSFSPDIVNSNETQQKVTPQENNPRTEIVTTNEDSENENNIQPVKSAAIPSVSIDYSSLEQAVEAGQWKNADLLTREITLRLTGRAGSYLRTEDIERLPCEDVNQINTLWTKYSLGHFGFTAQLQTWESIVGANNENQNVTQSNANNASKQFRERSLWNNQYKQPNQYGNLVFSTNAPEGHLPAFLLLQDTEPGDRTNLRGAAELIPSVVQRAKFCGQQQNENRNEA